MKCELLLACVLVLTITLIADRSVGGGYRVEDRYVSSTQTYWWEVYMESGSPPPFLDFHVETGDPDSTQYEVVSVPPGWQMTIVSKNDGSGTGWVSLYGSEPCTTALFRIRYQGTIEPGEGRWIVTNDGDADPTTGAIPDEGGFADAPLRGINTDLKVAVHVMEPASRSCSKAFPIITDCSDIIATCPENAVHFFPVFFGLIEYRGIEYSVDWPGTYDCSYSPCSDSYSGNIVRPAGTVPRDAGTDRISHSWFECQPGPIAIPGWGWICEPEPATITIVPGSYWGRLIVVDCGRGAPQGWNEPICNFSAGIAGAQGQEPCGATAKRPDSWGSIKALFR